LNLLDPFKVWTWDPSSRKPYRGYVNDLELAHQQLAEYRQNKGYPLTGAEQVTLETSLEDVRSSLRRLLPVIAKTTTVNCWHANEGESEAMWRLYPQNPPQLIEKQNEKGLPQMATLLLSVVGEAGLEPTTPGLEGRCSIQLSYSPV
jgi:hypothetical protein